jgi:hypothetical protein
VECPYCGSTETVKAGIQSGMQRYLCKNCKRKYKVGPRMQFKLGLNPCLQCGKMTLKPQFCSQSCSSTYSNLHHPKRYEKRRQNKRRYHCKHCGIEIPKGRTTCDEHNPSIVDWDARTIASITDRASYQIHGQIRFRARYVYYKSDRPKYCINCGYDTHIEVCHIRAIADFPPETPIGEINNLQNLAALCPNCHWELDNGVLPVEVVKAKNDTT